MATTSYLRPSQDLDLKHSTSSGSTGYNLINEVTPDEDATYIYANDAQSAALEVQSKFRFTGSITAGHRITAAKVVMRAKQNDVSSTTIAEVLIYINGTEYTRQSVTTSYVNYEWTIDTSLISKSGTSCTIDITLADNLRNDKNTPQINITQSFVELTTVPDVSYTITTTAIGDGTITGGGVVSQGENVDLKITPNDPAAEIPTVTDNGTDVTSQLVYVDPTPAYSFIGQVSGASYGFAVSGDYWVSQNYSQSNSAAVGQITFNCAAQATLVLAVINYAEATYDYGIVGAVNQTLDTSYAKDSGTTWDGSDSSKNKSTEQDITISLPAGSSFVQIKYRKDQGTSSNNDDFRVRIKSLTYVSPVAGYYRYTISNVQANHTVIANFGGNNFWVKLNGTWLNKPAYQKVNGSWVKLTTTPAGWSVNCALKRIHCPWTLDKAFKNTETSGPIDASGWLVSDYIAVTPDVECIVQGQGSTFSNTMWFAYKADKSYYDYWGGSGEQIATVDGTIVYKRTLSAANMANTYYIRVNAKQLALTYIKVWQNGVLLFDGSNYPIK